MSQAIADRPASSAARAAPKRRMRLSWSDPRFRAVVWQVVIVGVVVAIGWYLSATPAEPGGAAYRHRLRLPRPRRRHPDRRIADPLQSRRRTPTAGRC